jgi:tRNA threonylcarbamoyladenosine biosynthesis protein TsaE
MMIYNNSSFTIFLEDEPASVSLATRWSAHLRAPLILAFSGDIGAGKTTIIRAMLRALGIQCAIKSPTFSLVESYACTNFMVHHFDLYRIQNVEELDYIGFRDFFTSQSICCIEWAEHAGSSLPNIDLHCTLSVKGLGRELELKALSAVGQKTLAGLTGEQ